MAIAFFVAYAPNSSDDPNRVIKRINTFVAREAALKKTLPREIERRKRILVQLETKYATELARYERWGIYAGKAMREIVEIVEIVDKVEKAKKALEKAEQALENKKKAKTPTFRYSFTDLEAQERLKKSDIKAIKTYLSTLKTNSNFFGDHANTLLCRITTVQLIAAGEALITAIQGQISFVDLESEHQKALSQEPLRALYVDVKKHFQRAESPAADFDGNKFIANTSRPLPSPYLTNSSDVGPSLNNARNSLPSLESDLGVDEYRNSRSISLT